MSTLGGWGSGPWGGSAWGKSYFLGDLVEGAQGADAIAGSFNVDRSVSEGATVAEVLLDARQGFFTEVDERVNTIDNRPLAGWAYSIFLAEGASAADAVRSNVRFEVEIAENTTARDPLSAKYLWDPVSDNQDPNWQNVADTQTPGWTPVDDAQGPGWTDINP